MKKMALLCANNHVLFVCVSVAAVATLWTDVCLIRPSHNAGGVRSSIRTLMMTE